MGDGAGVAGAFVAIEEGRVAGITAAEQAGACSGRDAKRRRSPALKRLRSLARVRVMLDEMSRIRPGLCALARPDTLACRCEEATFREVDAALRQGARDLSAVKLLTRLGMGPCQGRNCGPSAAAYLACRLGGRPEKMGTIHARPPIKPVTVGMLARMSAGADGRTPTRSP